MPLRKPLLCFAAIVALCTPNIHAEDEVLLRVKPSEWASFHAISDTEHDEETISGNVTGPQPRMVTVPLGPIAAREVSRIVVRISATHGGRVHLYWATAEEPTFSDQRLHRWFNLPADGQVHELIVETSELESWKGDIIQLRIDPGVYSDISGHFELVGLELRRSESASDK